MGKRKVGLINIGIGFSMLVIITSFSLNANSIELIIQSIIGLIIAAMQMILGIKLVKSKSQETEEFKIIKFEKEESPKGKDYGILDEEEEKIINILMKEKEILQSELMERLNVNKVKMTRLLKKLEEKNFIFKKKVGMNNVVVLNE